MIKNKVLHSNIKAKRLIQILWAVEFVLFLSSIQKIYAGEYFHTFLITLTNISLVLVYVLAKQQKVQFAATFALSIMTIFATFFMWSHGGIYDPILLAYPCILIVASMVGNKSLFITLIVFMALSVLLNTLSNYQGWYINEIDTNYIDSSITTLLIISLVSYISWMVYSDFHVLWNQLFDEHIQALASKRKIEKLIHHDILTGLPNRMMAHSIFKKSISKENIKQTKVCLMFIDIDNFKQVNDGLSHRAGDELLKELSNRLSNEMQGEDFLCRFAGDEFVIILQSAKDEEIISQIALNIIKAIRAPFRYQNNELFCTCSIGISVFPNDGDDFDALIQNADTAMYHSKSIGGNSFHFFNTYMDRQGHNYIAVVTDLRNALKEGEFELYFQPQIDLLTQKIIGAEALIRWNHPKKGLIFPDSFIPQAEKSGLIVEIGEWVLQSACTSCKSFIELGFSEFSIAVNVSSQQLKRNNFAQMVHSALKNSNLPAKHLELEMTESLLIDNSVELKQTVTYLSDLGVSFSIDDFGTGYSNLSYLQEFEIEVLKIDRTFVKDIEHNPKNKALVTAIIQMAKGLSLRTVAEGVESEEVANLLKALQCDSGQGYHWSKAIPEKEFINLSISNIASFTRNNPKSLLN